MEQRRNGLANDHRFASGLHHSADFLVRHERLLQHHWRWRSHQRDRLFMDALSAFYVHRTFSIALAA